ncbi:hypothetical protein [Streptomyces bikiniensis]|uniref:hypothetical protein n=1 Tax=Streptomyces bikiniensis TaxID=1896 RepID=UPI0007C7A7D6|nr:hypothetical protein [Streptomyces bikiniensis]
MTETPSPKPLFTRPGSALAAAALASLALVACGSPQGGAASVQAGPSAAPTATAFTAMLDRVARSCPAPGPVEKPPGDAAAPAPTSGPEVELNARDWCASALHEERISRAVWELADPTPEKVRKVLNDLGYVDERIHGLRRSGTATTFALDLRDKGGRLCLDGSVDGERTLVTACVAPQSGPFAVAK